MKKGPSKTRISFRACISLLSTVQISFWRYLMAAFPQSNGIVRQIHVSRFLLVFDGCEIPTINLQLTTCLPQILALFQGFHHRHVPAHLWLKAA